MNCIKHKNLVLDGVSAMPSNFYVTNDVRQGEILSPLLFNVYMDGLR